MAKKQKAVKIKRYKNSMNPSKGKNTSSFIKKSVASLAIIGVLVGVGFFISEPFMNFLDDMGNSAPSANSQAITEATSSETEVASQTSENTTDNELSTPVITQIDNKVYYNANVNELVDEDTLASLIDVLKAKNITHCIIPIKDSQGYVYYDSENDYAYQAKNELLVNSDMVIETLTENGIIPVASISVFKDNLITVLNRNTSIFYQNTDARWLDNELAAGGKAWANPANEETQEYMMDIIKETMDLGFTEILLNDYQIPHQGYLAGMDFKVSVAELEEQMKVFAQSIIEEANDNGVHTIFTVDLASFKANDYSRYTQNPLEMFDGEILFLARTDSVLLEEDTNYISSLNSQYNLGATGLWITDIAQDQNIDGVDNFVKR